MQEFEYFLPRCHLATHLWRVTHRDTRSADSMQTFWSRLPTFLRKRPFHPSTQTIWETESQMVRHPLCTSLYPWDCLPHLFTLQPTEARAGSKAGVEDVGGGGGAHCNNDRISNPLESLSPQGEQSSYTLVKLSAAKRRLFCSCRWFIMTSTASESSQVHLKMSGKKIVWGKASS